MNNYQTVKRKQENNGSEKKEKLGAFDWDQEKDVITSSKDLNESSELVNSALISFLVLDTVVQSPPGSGAGLIPLFLPRQEKTADQELNQIKTLQREASVSSKNLIALSIYGVQISSDYRLFSLSLIHI